MRTLACSSIVLLLSFGCTGDDSTGDDVTSVGTTPTTSPATDTSAGTTEAPPDTTSGSPGTTTGPPPSTTDATGPSDSTGDDSGSTSAGGGDPGDWLLTVDRGSSPPRLMKVALTGGAVEVCALAGAVDYTSVVFTPDGTLYGHNATAGRIDEINPCNCSFQIIGPTSLGPIALGRMGGDNDRVLGLDPALDALVTVDLDTGLGTVVGPLTFMFGGSSLAWSDPLLAPYAMDGENDFLYTINPATGEATPTQMLSVDVTDPGLAVHPNDGVLYACNGNTLYTVDPSNGLLTEIGPLGLTGSCRSLTPPQTALGCIDSL